MAKILIADDDKDATMLMASMLKGEGYELYSTNDSHQVLEMAQEVRPDLILLDLAMPEPTGFQICRALREDPSFFMTPIVIVTALGDRDSFVVAFGAGADGYLIKPVLVEKLRSTVANLISHHHK